MIERGNCIPFVCVRSARGRSHGGQVKAKVLKDKHVSRALARPDPLGFALALVVDKDPPGTFVLFYLDGHGYTSCYRLAKGFVDDRDTSVERCISQEGALFLHGSTLLVSFSAL
jgi:hypothetical protein